MATGDAGAAIGLPVVPGTKDIRLGYLDINALADAVATVMLARIAATEARSAALVQTFFDNDHAASPTARGISAGNTAATGPDGGTTSIQSYLNLLNTRTAGL